MIPEHTLYVPTLRIRPSEMKAVEYSFDATKDNLKPCILLVPWANSYDKAIKRFEKAYPQRPYFLDIEKDYQPANPEGQALKEMNFLLDPANQYKNWIDFITAYRNVHPCIQCEGQNTAQIQQQIRAVKALERSYCLRIDVQNIPPNINDIIAAFAPETDYTVILEGGWTNNPLNLMPSFNSIISVQLNALNQNIPIVISCTSFLKSFTKISGVQPTIFENRQLVNQLATSHTNRRIVYGDWGSSRPRVYTGGGGHPIPPRIDYPAKDAWHIARNKGKNWDYHAAAKEIIKIPDWHGNLNIWGEGRIKLTAQNQALGINTLQKNTTSRINIHLHLQAFYYRNDLTGIPIEDDYKDTV